MQEMYERPGKAKSWKKVGARTGWKLPGRHKMSAGNSYSHTQFSRRTRTWWKGQRELTGGGDAVRTGRLVLCWAVRDYNTSSVLLCSVDWRAHEMRSGTGNIASSYPFGPYETGMSACTYLQCTLSTCTHLSVLAVKHWIFTVGSLHGSRYVLSLLVTSTH